MITIMSTLSVASIVVLLFSLSGAPVAAQTASVPAPAASSVTSPANPAEDHGWPRQFSAQGNEIRMYAPQFNEWSKFDRITLRAAILVVPVDGKERISGILRMSADTKVAFDERLVNLTNRKISDRRPKSRTAGYRATVEPATLFFATIGPGW